jgi:hypothetical protein
MSFVAEGKIEIPLSVFNAFLLQFVKVEGKIFHGVPRVNSLNNTLEIDFAVDSDFCPNEWAKKPIAVFQWEELKAAQCKEPKNG